MSLDPETTEYIESLMEVEVLSGYGEEEEIAEAFEEIVRDEAPQLKEGEVEAWLARLRAALEKQRLAEQSWKEPTANDRLTAAFDELWDNGIIALEDAGYTTSDGWEDIHDSREDAPDAWAGVFFHRQDVERGVKGEGLYLVFGAFDDEDHDALSLKAAEVVCETLKRHDLPVEWNGSIDTRIRVLPFEWKNRRWTEAPE